MARKRRRIRKKTALDYVALPSLELDSDTKKGIFIVLVLALGALSLLGLFDLAGSVGHWLSVGLTLAFGWGKWLFPVLLLGLGFIIYHEDKYYIRGANYLGLFLLVISFQALLHFFFDTNDWINIARTGAGGGFFGMYLAKGFYNVLGFWGGLIMLAGLFFIALMLVLETSLHNLIGSSSILGKIFYPLRVVLNKLFSRSDAVSEEDDEEDEAGEESEEDDEEDEAGEESEEEASVPEFMQTAVSDSEEASAEKPIIVKAESESLWKKSNLKIDLPLDLLSGKVGKPTSGDIKNNALVIQRTLENFGINVEMGDISVGPTVTQFTFKPAEGVKLSRITTLSNDLALALAAHPIRIEAPIPGKSLVGVEVPNQSKAIVGLREILESGEFKSRKSNTIMALGKDVSGKSWSYDIAKMPHLLVAGATNSGKSVCLNTIILSLLYENNPDDLKFIMVDPKRVELPIYNGIPHLLTPVITDVSKTVNALQWCLNEMDRRFEVLAKSGKKNIQTYNSSIGKKKKGGEKMPYLIFIIDELADLMVVASKDIEGAVIRLAQMARAVGIHLILATQRPSVDVITGLIKANMPARIAFSVASGTDSRTVLDSLGAEKLLGQGDMLFLTAEISKPKRIQGAFVSDQEIKRIAGHLKEQAGEANYIEGITERQKVQGMAGVGINGISGDEDALLNEAQEIVVNMGKASASLLQRRLRIGYTRAASILDMLEGAGIIGPSNGAKPREILISAEQHESMSVAGTSGVSLHDREEADVPDNYLGGEAPETPPVFKADNEEDEDGDNEEEKNDEEPGEPEKVKQTEEGEDQGQKINIEKTKEEDEDDNNNEDDDEEDGGKYFSK